ncbi:hypothetical protein [Nocardia asteroides]|uniref:hypothetical protein n=1 Tax=Nocardia asteroides TaxID=1824 RepID=UPI001E6463B3|nr:hypothetical protein [Nocardia asteroides]UGT52377.1 hypothetical protein LTT85_16665 [Nocardia asteroides]
MTERASDDVQSAQPINGQAPMQVDFIDGPLPSQPPATGANDHQSKLAAEQEKRKEREQQKPSAPATSQPPAEVPSNQTPPPAASQPEGSPAPAVPVEEHDPLLDAKGPNQDALPMPSTDGQEVGKTWTEVRPNGQVVEYTIPEGNGKNTVDAVVKDAAGNVVSTARIVAIEGTGKYVRWQDDVGGGASYFESGAPGELGYGQHFVPGASTSGIPSSVFESSPDLTRVRTISYDTLGNPIGIDVGSRNEFGLYDNTHSDMFGNVTFTAASFNSYGGVDSTFTGQIDSAGHGWMTDSQRDHWEVYPDEAGNPVQRRINPETGGYEFIYAENGIQVHELRDKSGRLLELSKAGPDGKPIKQLRRVGDILATGVPGTDGKLQFTFTDNTNVGTSLFSLPWVDRPKSRTGELTFKPEGGLKFSYTDGGLAEFDADGKSTAFRPADDTRALWKKAVSFAGSYYYGVGTSALGAVEGIGALTGINDQLNVSAKLFGKNLELTSRDDALKGMAGGIGELFVTAFNARRTLGVEAYRLGAGDESWGEAWRNVRRAVGANWNATSKLVIGTDWEDASGHLGEALGRAAFGAAMFFIPVKGVGAIGKGPKSGVRAASGGITFGTLRPSGLSSATRYINSRAMSTVAMADGFASKVARYGREHATWARNWGNQPVKSIELAAEAVTRFFADFQPRAAPVGGHYSVPAKASERPGIFASRINSRQAADSTGAQPIEKPGRISSESVSDIRHHFPPGVLVDINKVVDVNKLRKPLTDTIENGYRVLVDENGVPHKLTDKFDTPDTATGIEFLNAELKAVGQYMDTGTGSGTKYFLQADNPSLISKGYVNGTVVGSTADLVRATWVNGTLATIKTIDVTGTTNLGIRRLDVERHANTILGKLPGHRKYQTQNVLFIASSRAVAEALAPRFTSMHEVRILHLESGFDTRPHGWP